MVEAVREVVVGLEGGGMGPVGSGVGRSRWDEQMHLR